MQYLYFYEHLFNNVVFSYVNITFYSQWSESRHFNAIVRKNPCQTVCVSHFNKFIKHVSFAPLTCPSVTELDHQQPKLTFSSKIWQLKLGYIIAVSYSYMPNKNTHTNIHFQYSLDICVVTYIVFQDCVYRCYKHSVYLYIKFAYFARPKAMFFQGIHTFI